MNTLHLKPNEPQYANMRFPTKDLFVRWLNDTTKYTITFEDHGQDFIVWKLDERGEVLNSEPFQAGVWNGQMVDIDVLLKHKRVRILAGGRFIKYPVIDIVTNPLR